ncbi:L-threonylcarbamoyladenylate synthase [Salibacterium salarium]|uniref:L-threonylcarbamoyladenylate synthase n=1 Tax=Salibacterium salarium TaxID=284579 RepID=UPI00278521B3|nr:L-threonylcarbamoyladenylate synthase [Salibacterium salarium]MDQ0297814.1 L-threonylcarbamoyladenylate synthase [Salibacterium salarium]
MSYKHTQFWNVDKLEAEETSSPAITEAGLCISEGETVAFPTETVYGLGADATNDNAVDKIFKAKGRPGDNPLIVHIGNVEQWGDLASVIPEMAQTLADSFWPGPLTLIVPKKQTVSEKVTAGLSSVAVRMPDHAVARALINAAGVPVAAPSANRSGRPSPTKAEHVLYDLDGRIAGIIDGGDAGFGLESTVVDCTGEKAVILRPGGITREQIETVLGTINVLETGKTSDSEAPKAPGMKYRHYAPSSPLFLVDNEMEEVIAKERLAGKKIGVLAVDEHKTKWEPLVDLFIPLGSVDNLSDIAAHLYHHLRLADESKVDVILCETFSKSGVGSAIMNRLEKAASSS